MTTSFKAASGLSKQRQMQGSLREVTGSSFRAGVILLVPLQSETSYNILERLLKPIVELQHYELKIRQRGKKQRGKKTKTSSRKYGALK